MILNIMIILLCICETITLIHDYLKIFKNKTFKYITLLNKLYDYLKEIFLIILLTSIFIKSLQISISHQLVLFYLFYYTLIYLIHIYINKV